MLIQYPHGSGRQPPFTGFPLDCGHPVARGLVLCLLPQPGIKWYDQARRIAGLDAAMTGALAWGAGRFGPAVAFPNDATKYFTTGTAGDYSFIQNTGVFAISAWIKLNNHAANALQAIVSNTDTGSEKGSWFVWENRGGVGTKQLRMVVDKGVAGTPVVDAFSNTNAITDNNWHHVAAAGDGSVVRFYVDGIAAGVSGSMGSFSSGNSTRLMLIGALQDSGGPTMPLDGMIETLRIYDRTVTAGDVEDDFNEPYDLILAEPPGRSAMGFGGELLGTASVQCVGDLSSAGIGVRFGAANAQGAGDITVAGSGSLILTGATVSGDQVAESGMGDSVSNAGSGDGIGLGGGRA